jgi:hypothetical protein
MTPSDSACQIRFRVPQQKTTSGRERTLPVCATNYRGQRAAAHYPDIAKLRARDLLVRTRTRQQQNGHQNAKYPEPRPFMHSEPSSEIPDDYAAG